MPDDRATYTHDILKHLERPPGEKTEKNRSMHARRHFLCNSFQT